MFTNTCFASRGDLNLFMVLLVPFGIVPTKRRILMTKWLGDAWEDFTQNKQETITKAFKKCGMYNALDGSESHLIKMRKYSAYKAPKKEEK